MRANAEVKIQSKLFLLPRAVGKSGELVFGA